jgi:Peptidase family S58
LVLPRQAESDAWLFRGFKNVPDLRSSNASRRRRRNSNLLGQPRRPLREDHALLRYTTSRNPARLLTNDECSPLFQAVIEATEEAIYNSLLKATTVTGNGRTVEALPIDRTVEILKRHGAVR